VTHGRTDGQNYDSQDRASIAVSRGKKLTSLKKFSAGAIIATPKRQLLALKRHMTPAHPFAQLPKSYALQCFSVSQIPPKVSLSMWTSTPHAVHVPWTHPTQHHKLHLDLFSHFCIADGRESLYCTVCIKTQLMRDLKN